MSRSETQDREHHPSQYCGLCGQHLGLEDGYVTLVGGRMLTYCGDLVCMLVAQRLSDGLAVSDEGVLE